MTRLQFVSFNEVLKHLGRIKEDESIFWYRADWTTVTYTDLSYKPVFEFTGDDTGVCGDDLQCQFDVFMTNNTELGEDTARTNAEVKDKIATLGEIIYYIIYMFYLFVIFYDITMS